MNVRNIYEVYTYILYIYIFTVNLPTWYIKMFTTSALSRNREFWQTKRSDIFLFPLPASTWWWLTVHYLLLCISTIKHVRSMFNKDIQTALHILVIFWRGVVVVRRRHTLYPTYVHWWAATRLSHMMTHHRMH